MSADRFEDLARCAAAALAGDEAEWPAAARAFAGRHGPALARELLRTLTLFAGMPPVLRALDLAEDALAARGCADPQPPGAPAELGAETFARVYGPDAEPVLARLAALDPLLRAWVLEHAYGRGYQGALLTLEERERLAVLALAAAGCWKQCDSHLRACRRLGIPRGRLHADAAAGGWLDDAARAALRQRIGQMP